MSVQDFENTIGREWLIWGGVSAWGGFFMLIFRNPFWASFGIPCIVMGGILVLLSVWLRGRAKRLAPEAEATHIAELNFLNTLLWVMIVVSIIGVATGLGLVLWYGTKNNTSFGVGVGLIVQMGIVFAFNLWGTQKMPTL